MKLKKQGLEAFKFNGKQYYFKSYKVELFYNLLFLIVGSAIFYFYGLLFYAIVHNF